MVKNINHQKNMITQPPFNKITIGNSTELKTKELNLVTKV